MDINLYQGSLVIAGNSTVGKTSLIKMFVSSGKDYPRKYNMTTWVDVYVNVLPVFENDESHTVQLLLFDTSGMDIYLPFLDKYCNEKDMLLLVYDVTSNSSFKDLEKWLSFISKIKWNKNATSPILSAIFANKTDLSERRTVSIEEGKQLANKFHAEYFEGSAKTNEGVNAVFKWFADNWYQHKLGREL